MKTFKFAVSILFLILLGSSCTQDKATDLVINQGGELEFYLAPAQSVGIKAELQLANIRFIPLEGRSESLIGQVDKIDKDSITGRWYILDNKNRNAVKVFEEDGRFVKQISHFGNGPGEHRRINDFTIVDGKQIEILDSRNQKMLTYDLQTDSVLREKRVPFYAWEYESTKDGNYVFYKNSQANNLEDEKYFYKLLILNKDMNLIRSRFPFNLKIGQTNYSVMQPITLTKYNSSVNFNLFLADTIYSVTADTIEKKFSVDYGEYDVENLEKKSFSSGKEKIQYLADNTDKVIIGITNLIETSEYISFNFIYDSEVYTFLFDKISEEASIIKKIYYGKSNLLLPPPQRKIGSDYVGIHTWNKLLSIPIQKLKNDLDSYKLLLKAKREYQNHVLVLYNFNL